MDKLIWIVCNVRKCRFRALGLGDYGSCPQNLEVKTKAVSFWDSQTSPISKICIWARMIFNFRILYIILTIFNESFAAPRIQKAQVNNPRPTLPNGLHCKVNCQISIEIKNQIDSAKSCQTEKWHPGI